MTDSQPQTVLVIDDSQDIHDLISVRLRPEGVRLLQALDAESGLVMARAEKPDLLLLDLELPGLSGLELCRLIKDDAQLAEIPVIFLTGTVDVSAKVQAFDAGAIDYITKPFDAVELRARVRSALRTKRYYDMLATCARIDGLTGLWNRAYFDDRLTSELSLARRHARHMALVLVDVDHFKKLNDTYGHPFGDDVLRRVSQVLLDGTRQTDYACRYGGEEFALILRETDLPGAMLTAERIREALAALEMRHGQERVTLTASLGVCATDDLPDDARFSPTELVAAADRALYRAKHAGRNQTCAAQK